MIPRFLRTYSANRYVSKNFTWVLKVHHTAQYSLKTVVYAKHAPASSNLSFTPRNFCSNCVQLVSFRTDVPKTRGNPPIFDPPILGHIHGLSFLWGAAIWEMRFATGAITWLHAVGSYSRHDSLLSNYEAPVPRRLSPCTHSWVCCADEGVCCIKGHPIHLRAVRGTQTSWNVMDDTHEKIYTHTSLPGKPQRRWTLPQRPICCSDMCSDVMQWVLVTVPTQPQFLLRFIPLSLVTSSSVEPHTNFYIHRLQRSHPLWHQFHHLCLLASTSHPPPVTCSPSPHTATLFRRQHKCNPRWVGCRLGRPCVFCCNRTPVLVGVEFKSASPWRSVMDNTTYFAEAYYCAPWYE